MDQFRKPPTHAQQFLAAALGVLGCTVSGLATYFFMVPARSYLGAGIFGLLFVGSAWVVYRAMASSPRALGPRERKRLGLVLSVCGASAVVASFFAPELNGKLMLLAPGLSCIAYGQSARGR